MASAVAHLLRRRCSIFSLVGFKRSCSLLDLFIVFFPGVLMEGDAFSFRRVGLHQPRGPERFLARVALNIT